MATALLTINADAGNALNVIQQLQDALNNLQNNANLQFGMNANVNQLQRINRGITELTSLTNAWAAAITRNVGNALRDAFQEIRNIDDELVTIRRVTGRTGAELDALTAKATNVAKTYGTAASDYLKSVSSFSKAGYGEAADALGELSVKAQRVGDLTQEVSDQFLLAVDKGYQFNGSIEQLSAVLDGANEIGNKFATDIDQIAAGLGKVAPIAAQAHVSIYELEAALGTISAVTQRSGTEAATALRALFLNIMGDTKTEIEDGATWTAGEIEGLRDLLNIYAADVVKAAQETGKVINPMEAIAALSKAFREGVLTEQALVAMVSDIGGKLRTTQLLALIQNWDMYTAMVETATNATGSADKEIANSLDSITVKMNQLRAAWVDLVSDTVNSRAIKNILDMAQTVLNSFNNLSNVLTAVGGVLMMLRGYRIGETIRNIFTGLTSGGLGGFVTWIGVATTAMSVLFSVITNANNVVKQQIASFSKTTQEAANTSDSIYDLYVKVREAVPGTDEYTAALARLAAQMQLTGADAKNLAGNVDDYTRAALVKAAESAEVAYKELEARLLNKDLVRGNPFTNWATIAKRTLGDLRIDAKDWALEVRTILRENLWDLEDPTRNGYYTLFKEAIPTMTIEQLIRTYEGLQKAYEELGELSINDPRFANLQQTTLYKNLTDMRDALAELYEQAEAAMKATAETKANLALFDLEESGAVDTWRKINEDIATGAETSNEAINTVIATMTEFANKLDDGTLAGRYLKNSVIMKMAEQFPELARNIEEWKDVVGEIPKNGVAETAETAAKSTKELTVALSEATKAKREFDKAMEVAAENEGFKNYKEAYEQYAEEIEEGRVNSRRAKAAAKYLLGDEAYNAAYSSGGYKGVNAAMKSSNLDLLYGEESGDYAEGFFKFLNKYANQAGEIVNANGQIISSMTLVGDAIDWNVKSIEQLSEATGLSIGQIGAAADALGVYGTISFEEIEKLKDSISGLQGVTDTGFGILNVDYETFKSQFDIGDLMDDRWKSMKYYLNMANELGQVVLVNVTDGWYEVDDAMELAAQTAQSSAEEQKAAAEGAKTEAQALAEEAEAAAQAAKEAADGVTAEMRAIMEASEGAQTQITVINETIGSIKTVLGEEAANTFLESLQTAANKAGADITVTEGVVTELKGIGGQPMTWEMLSSLVSQAGQCDASLTELGGIISGLDDELPELTITVKNEDGIKKIETVGKKADEVCVDRKINIGAEGIEGEFNTVRDDAGKVVKEGFKFHYGAELDKTWTDQLTTVIDDAERGTHLIDLKFKYGVDGELESTNIQKVQEAAGEVTKVENLNFVYGIDGTLDTANKSVVQAQANGVTTETKYEFTYGVNGTLDKANVSTLYTDAKGVTTGVIYNFEYGASGQLIESSREDIRQTADGVLDKTIRKFKYGADGKPLEESITTIRETADSVTEKECTFYYTANGDRVAKSASLIQKSAKDYAEEVIYFHYDAEWNPTGKTAVQISQEADGVLKKRTVEFDANGKVVSDTVDTLTGEIDGLVNSPAADRTIVFQADGDKVLSTISDIEKAIADVQAKAKETVPKVEDATSGAGTEDAGGGEQYGPWPLGSEYTPDYAKDFGTMRDGIYPKETTLAMPDASDFGDSILGQFVSDIETAMRLIPTVLEFGANNAKEEAFAKGGQGGFFEWMFSSAGTKDVSEFLNYGAISLLSSLFGTNGLASWWQDATTASEPSWIPDGNEQSLAAEHASETFAAEVGETITDGISAWWQSMTTASEPSWLANVDVEATGDAEEIANVVGSDGKTVKVGANVTAKGDAEEIAMALGGDEDDKGTITKELTVEVSDDTQELMDGFYALGTEDDVTMSLRVSTDENGNKVLTMLEQSMDGTESLQTTFTVTGDGLIQIKEIKQLGDEIEEKKEMKVTADTSAANSSVAKLLNRLNQLKSKTINVIANVKGSTGTTTAANVGVNGGNVLQRVSNWLFGANARGSKHFSGGLSLINEEGPELVTANGWAKIIANGEPTVTNIPKGATIFNARETAKILGGAKQSVFPAFATGNLDAWGKALDVIKNNPLTKAINDSIVKPVGDFLSGVLKGSTGVGGTVTIPPKKEEEKKDDTKKTTTGGGGSAAKTDESEFWDVIQEYINYGLKKIQYQIDERQEAITALERERDRLMKPLDKELDELNWQIEEAEYRIKLIQRSRDDATKALKEQIDALHEAREIEEDEEQLEEKRLAVIEAQNALKDAQYDRTVRYYNEATGQWEWMADKSAVKNAEDALKNAEEAYKDALADYQISQLERQVKAIEKMYDEQAKPYQETVDAYNRQVEDLQYQRNKIEREYATSIDPLQEAMDEVQQTYDDLEKYYNRVQDAIAVPMSDLEAALTAMQGAEVNYSSQFENVQSLLDTLYDLAPTWDAISAGTLGVSAAAGAISNTNFADVLNNNGQTIIINGLSVEGDGSMSLNELIAKAGIYRNYSE